MCHQAFVGDSHNATPVASGVCCRPCNLRVVLPARFAEAGMDFTSSPELLEQFVALYEAVEAHGRERARPGAGVLGWALPVDVQSAGAPPPRGTGHSEGRVDETAARQRQPAQREEADGRAHQVVPATAAVRVPPSSWATAAVMPTAGKDEPTEPSTTTAGPGGAQTSATTTPQLQPSPPPAELDPEAALDALRAAQLAVQSLHTGLKSRRLRQLATLKSGLHPSDDEAPTVKTWRDTADAVFKLRFALPHGGGDTMEMRKASRSSGLCVRDLDHGDLLIDEHPTEAVTYGYIKKATGPGTG